MLYFLYWDPCKKLRKKNDIVNSLKKKIILIIDIFIRKITRKFKYSINGRFTNENAGSI